MRYPFEHSNVIHIEFSIAHESFATRRIDNPRRLEPTPHQVAQRQSEMLAKQYAALAKYHATMAELLEDYGYVDIVNAVDDVIDYLAARQVLITRYNKIGHGIEIRDDDLSLNELFDALEATEMKLSSVTENIYTRIYGEIPEIEFPFLPLTSLTDEVVSSKYFYKLVEEHAARHGTSPAFYRTRGQDHRIVAFRNHTNLEAFAEANHYRLGEEEGDGCGPIFHGIKVVGTWERVENRYGLDKWKAKVKIL